MKKVLWRHGRWRVVAAAALAGCGGGDAPSPGEPREKPAGRRTTGTSIPSSARRAWVATPRAASRAPGVAGQDRLEEGARERGLATRRGGDAGEQPCRRLTELPPKQRLAVELRLFHELSFQEIAALADCSEDSAKANFHHGIKRLRGLIPDPGG
ncbi:sigma-70 family RNA polymerase sigma factor [Sorangium sp. So ce269]